MTFLASAEIHPNPKTASQLRATLAQVQAQDDALTASVSENAAAIGEIEVTNGPVSATFASAASEGQALYIPSHGNADLADATAPAKAVVVGLVSTGAASGQTGKYLTAGRIARADWSAVAGTVNLSPGVVYYLSGTTPGRIAATAPDATGTVVVVGRALDNLTLAIEIEPGVLL